MGVKFTDEQQAVIDARDCNILVSAAAGSGKTAVLVERIIQMISADIDIDHLLVVTFTKAAASQMREKITLAIQDKLQKEPDNKHLQKQETLIHNAQITTIDSFCQYVVKNNFNTIGLDPSFHVGDDGELKLLQDEVMQDMLEEEYILAASGQNEDFVYCMEYFSTGSSDKKVEEYISSIYRFAMSMPWPEDWIRERAGDYDLEDKNFDELYWVKSCMAYAGIKIREMVDKLVTAEKICCESDGPYMYGDVLEKDKEKIESLLKCETYDSMFDAIRAISFDSLSRKRDSSVNPDKKNYVQDLRNEVKGSHGMLTKLREKYFALPSDTVIGQMKLCDRAVRELCRLALRYKELFDAKKRERGIIDFPDMEHFALQILVNHPKPKECENLTVDEIIQKSTPSEVALEYRDYYREVLIDEYQDSNNVQELILKSISGEKPEKSERFMVGDVKQSIYKFRLARPEIFMEKLGTYDKAPGSMDRRIDLHKNFRSRKEVLEITNYIFEKIMGKDLGSVEYDEDARLVTGADYPQPSIDVTPELIMLSRENEDIPETSSYDFKEKEALVVAERINELLHENPALSYKDIVILLRSPSGWDEFFKRVLEEQGIPSYVESKSGYFDAKEVAVLLDLLTVIDNPSQDIPLVSVMHSEIGGFTDEDLSLLRSLIDTDEIAAKELSLYGALKRICVEKAPEDKPVLNELKKFTAFIEDLREMSVYTPVHELLQHILDVTGFDLLCLSMPGGSQRKANIDLLLSKALAFEKTSFKGLFHFVRYIENMKVVQVDYGEAGIIDENANVVRIMSIHKSKGLEFPVVFVSGTSKEFNTMDVKGDLITDMDHGLGVKCIDLENRVKYDTLKMQIIADKMLTDNLGEELRVLYVALTRAKEKLIITASVKKPADTIAKISKDIPVLDSSEKLLPYSKRAGASSYFDLILPAVIRHPGFGDVFDKLQIPRDIFDEHVDKEKENGVKLPSFSAKFLTDSEIAAAMIKRDVMAISKKDELLRGGISFDEELAGRLLAKFESKYAYECLKGLFTKTTVTELKKHMLEEAGEVFTSSAEFTLEDAGDNDNKKHITGAERGTAYHRIMEILDDSIYGDEKLMEMAKEMSDKATTPSGGLDPVSKRIYAWMCEKVTDKVISEDYKKSIWTPDVTHFLSTSLGQRMGQAFRSGMLKREKPFMMGISARELDEKFPEEEMVLIQGIIDAWFIEDDEIVLLDYKTDRVKQADELVSRYKIQLELYKRALEASTMKKVKEVLIYSFALGEVIELDLS
ncbi:MAG: helicase-exonuclease AddAB subunit AddA [Butyrivibrio sp.]|nr:helicase-exonuclease AddAB subunit AddA [Butyrivibrio sp.]